MADWLSSLLAGLGAGAESLGTSMSEREKRDAAAKQRAFELKMQQNENNLKLGITDEAPFAYDDDTSRKFAESGQRLNAWKTPSMDALSNQLQLGYTPKDSARPPIDFGIGKRLPDPPPDMSDAATNYEVSGTGASTFGSRPASPRFDNFTDQTVLPAVTPASGGSASATIAKMLQPEMAPPVSKAAAPVSAAEQDLIDYGTQVRTNPKARQTLASVMKGKTPEEQAVYMADRVTAGKLPAARQVEFDKIKAMGPQAYLNDVEIRLTPDMGPPSSLAGSDTLPTAPPSDPSAAPMAPAAGPRTVSAPGAPTMPRTRLGDNIPDVQSQLDAVRRFARATPESASYIYQYDPEHPEAGLVRKRFNYQAGSDYAKKQAEENLPSNLLERQVKQGQIDDRKAQEQTRLAKAAANARTEKYLQSNDYFQDVQAVTNSGSPAALARITANTAGSDHVEGVDKVIQSALNKRNIDPNSPAGIAAQIAIAQGKAASGTKGADSEYSKMPADRVLRVVQGVHNMAAVHPEMEKFEQDAKANPALFTGVDQFLKEYNSEIRSGPVGFMHNLFKSQAITTLNKKNPALAQYIRNGLRYAQGENEYQSRTSDFRTQMADMLATISSNMSPASIDAVTAGRKGDATAAVQMANQLRDVHKLPSDPAFAYFGSANSQTPSGNSVKVLTPAQYKAARTHYTDAEIQAQGYTIPRKTP